MSGSGGGGGWDEQEAALPGEHVFEVADELDRLKVEYTAAIERGMRATAELQGKLTAAREHISDLETSESGEVREALAEVARLLEAVEAWRKAESAVDCEACAVFGASLPEGK